MSNAAGFTVGKAIPGGPAGWSGGVVVRDKVKLGLRVDLAGELGRIDVQ